MKRFHFQLDKLLRYHQQRQKQAELMMARARGEQETASAAARELERRIDSACRLPERVGRSIEPALREQSLRHARELCEILRGVQENLKAAERRFRESQSHHTAVTQQVEALLHIRSQRRQEHLDEAARQQQIELDDVVMTQWSRRMLTSDSPIAASESTVVIEDQAP